MDPSESNLHSPDDHHGVARRRFLAGLGWGGLSVFLAASLPGLIRFLWPQGQRGDPDVVDVGPLPDYRNLTVSTRWIRLYGLWVVNRDGRLFALEARCTHLGCTPRWVAEGGVFLCPCHGSRFTSEGVPLNGPATLPLNRLAIRLERDQVVVDRSVRAPMEEAERDPRFFIQI